MTGLDYAILVVYAVGITLAGGLFAGQQRSLKEFFLADRNIPWWAAAFSGIATIVSAISYLGAPGQAFRADLTFLQYRLVVPLVLVIICVVFIPFFHRLELFTAYEYLERRFDTKTRLFASVLFLLFKCAYLGIGIYAPALVIAGMTDIPFGVLVIASGSITTLYTMMGGMRAVIWTDAIQLVVLLLGLAVTALVIGGSIDGGWGTVMRTASDAGKLRFFDTSFSLHNELTLWASLLGGMVLLLNQYGVDQAEIQRFLTTSSVRKSQAAVASAMIFASVIGFGLFLIGAGLFVFYQQFPDKGGFAVPPDRVFPKFIAEELPTGLKGLLLAGVFSAGMSTVSSVLHSLSTVMMADFFVRRGKTPSVGTARFATIGFGILCTGIALIADRFGNLLVMSTTVNNLFGGPLVGVFLLGLLTKRANGTGTCIGAAAGFVSAVLIAAFTSVSWMWYGVFSVAITMSVALIASPGFPAPSIENLRLLYDPRAAKAGALPHATSVALVAFLLVGAGAASAQAQAQPHGSPASASAPAPVAITYGQEVDVPMPAAFHVFAARPADWDGDGKIDLLATPATGGAIYLLKNIGTPKAPRFDFPYADPPLLGKARGRWTLFDFIDEQYGAQGQKPGAPAKPASSVSGASAASDELPIGRTFDVADMDGDGDLDLVLARANQVAWLRNTGTKAKPAWGAPEPIVDPRNKAYVFDDVWATINPEAVDWDGDGLTDLILGIWHPSRYGHDQDIRILQPRHAYGRDGGYAYWLRNVGTKTQPRYAAPVALASNTGVIAGLGLALTRAVDWDGDGDLDLTVAFYDASIRYYENTGTRTAPHLVDRGRLEADGQPIASAVVFRPDQAFVDLDGDGDLDMITGGHGLYVGWFENVGSRTAGRLTFRGGLPMRATASTPVHLGNIITPVTHDVDGDGTFDLLSGNEAGLIVWSKNRGSAEKPVFSPVEPLPGVDGKPLEMFSKELGMSMWGPLEDWDERTSPVPVDWDGDGLWDVVTSTMSGRVYWIRNAGTRQAPRLEKPRAVEGPSGPLLSTPRSRPGVPDWNGDGVPDLVVPDERGVLTIFLGARAKDGKGPIALTRTIVPVSPQGDALVMNPVLGNTTSGRLQHDVADWDGDGKLDVLVSTRRDTSPRRYVIMWYRNIGTSEAPVLDGRELLPSVDSGHEAGLHVVDWNKDGVLDVITGDQEGRVWLWDGRRLRNGRSEAPAGRNGSADRK